DDAGDGWFDAGVRIGVGRREEELLSVAALKDETGRLSVAEETLHRIPQGSFGVGPAAGMVDITYATQYFAFDPFIVPVAVGSQAYSLPNLLRAAQPLDILPLVHPVFY
ncbi:MAG: hypothetical protein LQ341_002944, partial [Variospora aurantia]